MPKLIKGDNKPDTGGINEEKMIPYLGAGMTYNFSDYKLKTESGDVTVRGSWSFNNEFTPDISGTCAYAVSGYRTMQDNLFGLQLVSLGAAAAVKVPIYSWAKYMALSLASIGQPAYAKSQYMPKPVTIETPDNKLSITFTRYTL